MVRCPPDKGPLEHYYLPLLIIDTLVTRVRSINLLINIINFEEAHVCVSCFIVFLGKGF